MKQCKTLFCFLCVMALCLSLLPLEVQAAPAILYVNTGTLNLRSAADSADPENILAKLPRGTAVTPKEELGDWIQVQAGELTGYVYRSLLTDRNPNPPTMYVKTGNNNPLRMRETADNTSAIVLELVNGEAVLVYSVDTGWAYVSAHGKEGYVFYAHLTSISPEEEEGDTPPENPTATQMQVATGNSQGLRLRAEPNTSSSILGIYDNGTVVTVLSTEDGWARVQVNGQEGYMALSRLAPLDNENQEGEDDPTPENPDPENPGTEDPDPVVMYVQTGNSKGLNLRKEANASSDVLGTYKNDTKVLVYTVEEGWAKVQVDGKEGYMLYRLLTSTVPTPPPQTTPMYVVRGPQNLLSAPTAGAAAIASCPVGAQVGMLFTIETGWARVIADGVMGYLPLSCLAEQMPGEEEEPAPDPEPENPGSGAADPIAMYVADGPLALRSAPEKKNQTLLGFYPTNTPVTVYEIVAGWARVQVNGASGYMMASYLAPVVPPAQDGEGEGEQPEGSTPPAQTMEMVVRTGNNGGLALRSKAQKGDNIKAFYPNGTRVTVYSIQGIWAKVSVNGTSGYMMVSMLAVPAAPETPDENNPGQDGGNTGTQPGAGNEGGNSGETADPLPQTKTVYHPKGSFVNFRSSATDYSDANIIGKIASGTQVEVVSKGRLFTKIIHNGMTGYINNNYLK
ncbi:MAG: hypothetical protein E7324_04910 [Clostridiales bacterium]|nr:hypothetical protein [Clostridiales bacterium]